MKNFTNTKIFFCCLTRHTLYISHINYDIEYSYNDTEYSYNSNLKPLLKLSKFNNFSNLPVNNKPIL